MARLERGLTLRQAAEKTGVSKETISELERGLRKPHPPTLYKIADGYGIGVSDLLEQEEKPEASLVGAGKAEAPQESGQPEATERRPTVPARDWAAELGAELHGMSDEEWARRLSGLATREELAEAWKRLQDEAGILHDALRLDKWSSAPSGARRRRELNQGLRDIRIHRFADLAAEASLLRAQELVDDIFAAMKEESLA
ncbi:MAG: helix-turn-helix transcriptional regulator [Chloroflexota bacterium]|nr:helix-turn-helix transcriptional regulator [Chloroflexota bacterium]